MATIFHLIDNIGLGGAQAMMFELHYAINKYYPKHQQFVYYTHPRWYDSAFVASSGIVCREARNHKVLSSLIKSKKDSVLFYHKLASSNFRILDDIRKRVKVRIIVINHTLYNSTSWKNLSGIEIVAVSKHMLGKLGKWYPKMTYHQVYNGVNQDRYDPIPPKERNKKGMFFTGRVNRICGWKHSDSWLKWCKSVSLPCPMVHEYIGNKITGGRTRMHKQLKGGNKLKMLGGISDFKTKVSIMKSWDVFLYETNRNEGLSMSVLESLACGIPVVCSDHYGNKEVIENGVNGYIFKDREEARKIIKNLIKNPAHLASLKKNTRRHFREKLDAENMAHGYMRLING